MRTFEELVAEADAAPFAGWDFRFLDGRYLEGRFSWDYRKMLAQMLANARSYLDLGTGGGELVSSLGPLPARSVVTEGFAPNAHVARRELGPLGVDVVVSFCDDNSAKGEQRGSLPFQEGAFDVVSDRHEAFVASEVAAALRPGGTFITQQVGPDNDVELARLVGEGDGQGEKWDLDEAVRQVRGAGLRVIGSGEETVRSRFLDVGALAYYLKTAGPLSFKEMDRGALEGSLRKADSEIRAEGAFQVSTSRFYLVAVKAREHPPIGQVKPSPSRSRKKRTERGPGGIRTHGMLVKSQPI